MALNLFFNQKFEKLIDELGILAFSDVIDNNKLTEIRDNSKNDLKGKPEEAATRVFLDLVILNQKIPVERRLVKCFEKINLLKIWCLLNNSVNIDLYLIIMSLIEQMVSEYAGKQYEKDFYDQLNKMGVVIPLKHDALQIFGLLYLYNSKQRNNLAYDAAIKFYTDILSKNVNEYASCVREDSFDAFQEFMISPFETI